ncbi:TRDC protein, partial [Pitta sordida]|nr:TRDC protein [Pitta sordida]
MKSKQLGEGGSSGKAACLARNFNTKNISLEMSPDEVVYEQSTSILTSEGLYSAMKVISVTKDTEVTCKAHFKSSTITANATLPGTVWWHSCNLLVQTMSCTKVERVNMVSLAVLGLGVLLAKSIAFNTFMSMKMFLF